MDAASTLESFESQLMALLEKRPIPTADALTLIHSALPTEASKKTDEWFALLMQELTEAEDFNGLYLVIKARADRLAPSLSPVGIRDLLRKACKDRLITAFIETAAFGDVTLAESFRRLDLLSTLTPGAQVIDPAWGFGTVKRLDDFYKRIAIDFAGKPGHTMTFATVSEGLVLAPHDHLLTIRHNSPETITRMTAEKPGELVRLVLRSFGEMPVTKLEEVLAKNGIVPTSQWKGFWDAARKALKNDPLVTVPTKRSDHLQLRAQVESYGDAWFESLATNRDSVKILDAINELEAADKLTGLESTRRGILEDRLAFAIKGAHNTDAALYARLATTVARLGFLTPPLDQLRAHLWEQQRFIKASEGLAVRDIASMTTFLLADGNQAGARLLAALPAMPFSMVNETLSALKQTQEAEETCRALLSLPKAPPTLVNWIFRFRKEVAAWHLPPLIDLLNHAIVIVESRLSGEALRMQNNLKLLFGQAKWLEAVFEELAPAQRHLFFDRIQASTAWDPSTHRSLIGRMLKLDPALAERKKSAVQQTPSTVRWTSWRSLAAHQLQYKKLVEVELPKNSHDIAVARSYGDLRENFEYQAAKDLQRQLLQRQSEMQLELKTIKGTDFADVACDKVGPGTTVVLRMADGSSRTYTILGEWDSDSTRNIISNKTRLALCLENKTVGETAMIPAHGGEEAAIVEAIQTPDAIIKEWMMSAPDENE